MARPRKPLSEQTGNLTVKFQRQREFEEALITVDKSQLIHPPDWLVDEVAVNEYKRVTKLLDDIEIIGNLDLSNIGGYCNAYAMYCKATSELARDISLNKSMKVIGGNGQEVENPLIGIQRKYAQEMRNFERLCGLTVDSRLKFASSKAKEIDDNITDNFGDI